MKGLFLFLFLLKGGERGREKRSEKRSFRTSFSLLLSVLHFLPALSHLLEEKANFWKNSESFCFPPINQCHHPLFFFSGEGEGKRRGGNKKHGETWLKERTRKRGPWRQLLERLVRDFQPLTSVVASSPTWSRQGPEQARGPIWKGTGPSLILWRNCLQVGPSIPQ